MRRGLGGKGPKLPGVHVWTERIDGDAYAVFACRQWDGAPRLTAWKIITSDQGEGWDWQWRGTGLRLLMEAEAKINARWYVHAQRRIIETAERHGVGTAMEEAFVGEFYEALKRPARPD